MRNKNRQPDWNIKELNFRPIDNHAVPLTGPTLCTNCPGRKLFASELAVAATVERLIRYTNGSKLDALATPYKDPAGSIVEVTYNMARLRKDAWDDRSEEDLCRQISTEICDGPTKRRQCAKPLEFRKLQ